MLHANDGQGRVPLLFLAQGKSRYRLTFLNLFTLLQCLPSIQANTYQKKLKPIFCHMVMVLIFNIFAIQNNGQLLQHFTM
jgi:hypothetical protein